MTTDKNNEPRDEKGTDKKDEKKKGLQLVDGKVYLRDTRNGRVHQYEESLSQMGYMQRFIAGEKAQKEYEESRNDAGFKISLSGVDRAAEWDRRAAMTPDELKAYDAKRSKEAAASREGKTGEEDYSDLYVAPGVETTASGQPASGPAPAPPPPPAADARQGPPKPASAPPSAPEKASKADQAPPPPPRK